VADSRQFRLEIERWLSHDVPEKAVETQKLMVAEALTLIVQATPVGNHTRWRRNQDRAAKGLPPLPKGYVGGQARRNWQVTFDVPARSVRDGVDPQGQLAIGEGYATIGRIARPSLMWISNPLPYMDALENGWSKQAPTGMVAQAVRLISQKYARVA